MSDGELAMLAPAEREAVSQVWLARAHAEMATASLFETVARAACEIGAVAEVRSLTARAAQDEARHARLCLELAELYAGRSLPVPSKLALEAPTFGDAPRDVNGHLLLIYQCCLSEGIASVYLQENLRLARALRVRELICALLRDDVVHARIGWAHLASASLSREVRWHVGAALPTLLRLARQAWLRLPPGPDLDCPEHGCLGRFRHPAIVDAALEHLILPGFAHLGFACPLGA